jgi:fumagillin biosynthesis cytochrome P450 monooxygenase
MIIIPFILVLAFGYVLYRLCVPDSTNARLPPGPKGWPIIGNLFDLPPKGMPEYQHWIKHKDAHGPISSVTVMGQPMIILHDKEAARELMVQNSMKTSSRPQFAFALNMGRFGTFLPFMSYGDTFRRHRKFIHQQLGTQALASQYNWVQEAEAAHLLLRALEHPQDLMQHFKT